MKAFTQLCQKVNISIFDDTITLYHKKTGGSRYELMLDPETWMLFAITTECVYQEVDCAFDEHLERFGVKRFVHRDDPDHARYHADTFSMDTPHFHAQYSETIDQKKLKEILSLLVEYNVLSDEEKICFIAAYEQANQLEQATPDLLPAVLPDAEGIYIAAQENEAPQTTPILSSVRPNAALGGSFFSPSNRVRLPASLTENLLVDTLNLNS